MAEQLPIKPSLLLWARERAGLSLDEAAQKFKRIAEWEAGASAPTYPQLEQLSDALRRIAMASQSIGIGAVLVQAKSDSARRH